jgi:hypothetical protein
MMDTGMGTAFGLIIMPYMQTSCASSSLHHEVSCSVFCIMDAIAAGARGCGCFFLGGGARVCSCVCVCVCVCIYICIYMYTCVHS